jgi:hypothetical protein
MSINSTLHTYPRRRQALPPAYDRVYVDHHRRNRLGASTLQKAVLWMESWMHRRIACDGNAGGALLEIGAGTLNHVGYEPGAATYDVVEPFKALYEDSPQRDSIRNFYSDIEGVPRDACYDRVISSATLEHIEDLPRTVARAALLLQPAGQFQAGIPTEGGLLWGLSWRASTAIAFRLKTGLDYGLLMRWEHINTAQEIEEITKYFFRRVSIRRFPIPTRHLSFYTSINATVPDYDACRRILGEDA